MATSQRFFTDAFRDMQRAVSHYRGGNYPPTDVIEHSENFTMESELPGYTKKNIKIELVDTRTLVLSGCIDDDDYEAHHSSTKGREQDSQEVQREDHGMYYGSICKSCEGETKKSEEAQAEHAKVQEKKGKEAQVKKDEAQAKSEEAQIQKDETQGKAEAPQTKQEQGKHEEARGHQRRAQYLIKERSTTESFSRVFTFSTHIKVEGIKARFEDGILKAIVPKVNVDKHQQINIE